MVARRALSHQASPVEPFPENEQSGRHCSHLGAWIVGEFHRFRAADLDELRLELLHCAALEMRSDRGLIAVTLHQSPLLAVSAQIKLIVQRSRFLLTDANHLFRDCLKFPELTVMDFQINQQTNASGCQAFLLGSIEIAPFLPNFLLGRGTLHRGPTPAGFARVGVVERCRHNPTQKNGFSAEVKRGNQISYIVGSATACRTRISLCTSCRRRWFHRCQPFGSCRLWRPLFCRWPRFSHPS